LLIAVRIGIDIYCRYIKYILRGRANEEGKREEKEITIKIILK